MDETKATARLPNLNIEVTHRQSESGDAEYVAVKITAAPSFEAFGAYLDQQGPSLMGGMGMMPFAPWLRMMQLAWRPWLKLMGAPPLLERDHAGDETAAEKKSEA